MKNRLLKEQSFTQGAAVLLFSTIIVKLIGAFFKIPLSHDYCLGDLGFGYFSFGYDIYIPIYTLASSGFPVAISKIMSDYSASGREEAAEKAFRLYRNIMLILGVMGSLAIFVISTFDLLPTNGNKNLSNTLLAMTPAVLFCCLSSVYRGAFESKKNMTPTAVSNVIEALSKVVLGFGSAFVVVRVTNNLLFGAAAAMLGISLGTLISYLYLKISYSSDYKTEYDKSEKKENGGLLKNLIFISLPIVFASLSVSLVSLIDALTVNFSLSSLMNEYFDVLAEVFGFSDSLTEETLPTFLYGIRSKAYTLFHLVPTFTSALAISALPALTAAFSSKNDENAKQNTTSLIKFSSLISFPLGLGMIFMGKPVMSLLYGENTSLTGGVILQIYGFAAVFCGICIAFTALLQAVNKQNIAFINFAVGLVFKFVFNIILVRNPKINIFGAAISTVICYTLVLIMDLIIILKSRLMPNVLNTILKPMIAAIICGFTAYGITFFSESKLIILLSIFVAAVVYFGTLFLLKTFNKSDLIDLPFSEKIIKLMKIS